VLVSTTEDAARYRGPVTFHNGQLLQLLGFGKWQRLDNARSRAVIEGWLNYEAPPSGTRGPGKYFAVIPDHAGNLPDTPVDETDDLIAAAYHRGWADGKAGRPAKPYPEMGYAQAGASPETGYASQQPSPKPDDGAGYGPGYGAGYATGALSIPTPSPCPNTSSSPHGDGAPPKKSRAKKTYTEEFARWYALYPKKVGKDDAAKAFPKALRRICADRRINEEKALAFLCETVSRFAKTPKGQAGKYCWDPASWLNGGHFDDDPSAWDLTSPSDSRRQQQAGNAPYHDRKPSPIQRRTGTLSPEFT
jgi:hypothetical protein